MEQSGQGGWRFAVDRGGTFTDVVGIDPHGQIRTAKLLSESIAYQDAAVEGMRQLLEVPPGAPLPAQRVAWIRLGTTVATNALLERKGTATGLLITQGFRDLLEIGDQCRPDLFALAVKRPELLYEAVAEVPERLTADGAVETPLDLAALEDALAQLKAAGVTSLAVVFLHAWRNPIHECMAGEAAQKAGFQHVSLSHRSLALIQVVGRGRTTLVDAYLTPVLMGYVQQVRQATGTIPLHFMSSSGGLLTPGGFTGKDAILSGPAGGVLGCAAVAAGCGDPQVIGFDMGGTSTDVCRYDGTLERILEVETAGIRYQAPMLHVKTVAAGGGSLLSFRDGRLMVGPGSAGANPGPACYGLGGPATLTDANLVLGRIVPAAFPRLFGPTRDAPLDPAAAWQRLAAIAAAVTTATGQTMGVETLALGFVRIADETMGEPIKALSVARGYDLRDHVLVCFGGAGAQHACGLARALGMTTVRIHPLAGLLSAYGIALAPHRRTMVRTLLIAADAAGLAQAQAVATEMGDLLEWQLRQEVGEGNYQRLVTVDVRSFGTDTPLTVTLVTDPQQLADDFQQTHARHYGFQPPPGVAEVVHVQVEVVDLSPPPVLKSVVGVGGPVVAEGETLTWFDAGGAVATPLWRREKLPAGWQAMGPALILAEHSTVVVEPGFAASVAADGVVTLRLVARPVVETVGTRVDPVLLELFNRRFMGIASQMGETLARTAHSVNIKERWDFSCAIFDGVGRLVANAPHVPVHLGAMGETVRSLLAEKGRAMCPGDAYATNDPARGGSHLPDVTVITPLFRPGAQGEGAAFFVASRGHHADIGGVTPGSMPIHARCLAEEGVLLAHLLVVRQGIFQKEAILAALNQQPYPARNLPERLSDLGAQLAANNKGIGELEALCQLVGDQVVIAYMDHMRANAHLAMVAVMQRLLNQQDHWQGRFADRLDGGEVIQVAVTVAREEGGMPRLVVDFAGSAPVHRGNLNAPPAVVRAAVLYVLRTLVDRDIPLNDGCLEAVTIRIPAGSMLDPGPGVPVAGGNVETSQRIVDVLLGAFGVAAASQGTMNNFLFGRPDGTGAQYYETIAGGAGATATAAGASGVQVHMTNTRMTDPEVLEHRFPHIRLAWFHLRRGSGGKGRTQGGDGVCRALRFLEPMMVTILSERRETAPFGLAGGEPGKSGENRLLPAGSETWQSLPGRFQGVVAAGDLLEIRTPGGGGYGKVEK